MSTRTGPAPPATRSPSSSAGQNYARLKVWVNPADGYNNKTRVLAMAKRIKAQGMKLLVDFHYSDTWADPGAQGSRRPGRATRTQPRRTDVYNHTTTSSRPRSRRAPPPTMVQVGNEINGGMLWPWVRPGLHPADTGAQLLAGCSTPAPGGQGGQLRPPRCRCTSPRATTAGTRWWFDSAVSNGVKFDVIGLSYYGYWHGTLADFQTRSRRGLPLRRAVLLAETAYPFRLDGGLARREHHRPVELVSGLPGHDGRSDRLLPRG